MESITLAGRCTQCVTGVEEGTCPRCRIWEEPFAPTRRAAGKKGYLVYSMRTALMTPSCPGLLTMRARPISVLTTAPLVRRFLRT